jgi:hypothetical protein
LGCWASRLKREESKSRAGLEERGIGKLGLRAEREEGQRLEDEDDLTSRPDRSVREEEGREKWAAGGVLGRQGKLASGGKQGRG